MTHRLLAAAPAPCRPAAGLLFGDQRGAPAPMTRPARSPRAAKRSDLLAFGASQAWPQPLADLGAVSTPTRCTASASLASTWLCAMAALDRSSLTRFHRPGSWPQLYKMNATGASESISCCFGGAFICHEGAVPACKTCVVRLYGTCGPDAGERTVKGVTFKADRPLLLSCH